MENVSDLVFENREHLYKKVIDLYTTLLAIKIVDVVDDVTNIKEEIEYNVIDSSVLEKTVYYVGNVKIKLQDVYNKFGIEIDNNCSLDGYILIADMINKLETLEKDNLDFLDYLLYTDEQTEDKFIKLLDELYPLSNNIQYIEYIDVSDYLFENIIKVIYDNKTIMDNNINTEMVNKMVKALGINKEIKNTIIFESVLNGELNIVLSIDQDTELVLNQLKEVINILSIDEYTMDDIVLNIFAILYLYKDESELSYYLLNSDLSNYLDKFKDKNIIVVKLNSMIHSTEV